MGRTLEVLRGIDLDIDAGRSRRHRRPVRRRQEHAAPLRWHARPAHRAARSARRAKSSPLGVGRAARGAAQPHHRLRLSVSSPLAGVHRARERDACPGSFRARAKREMEARGAALLDEVGLARPRDASARRALGRRAAAGRAGARARARAEALLADEPTGNLDTATSDAMHDLFFQINRRAARPSSSSRTTRASPSACRGSCICATARSRKTSGGEPPKTHRCGGDSALTFSRCLSAGLVSRVREYESFLAFVRGRRGRGVLERRDRRPKGLAEGCIINTDCSSPLVCAFRKCHQACTSSRDCEPGQRCMASDRPFHVCQLPDERLCCFQQRLSHGPGVRRRPPVPRSVRCRS